MLSCYLYNGELPLHVVDLAVLGHIVEMRKVVRLDVALVALYRDAQDLILLFISCGHGVKFC